MNAFRFVSALCLVICSCATAADVPVPVTKTGGVLNGSLAVGNGSTVQASGSGTIIATQIGGAANAHTVYAGPTSGSAANPFMRTLVAADIPAALSASTSVNGLAISSNGGVALGGALASNVSGTDNVAIGGSAMSGNQSGGRNIAIGPSALNGNHSSDNIAIGYQAMFFSETANNNLAIGKTALSQNITGGGNTAVGFEALYSAEGNGNVALGNNAGSYWAGSNKLFIDNQDRGSEANDQAKALIYGEFDADPANQRLTVNAELVASRGVIKGGATAIMPIQVYVKNVTVLTAGAPADIATISIPPGITRYILPGSVTAQDAGLIVAETAAGTLANGFFQIRDAAGGAGNQMTDSRTGPTGASTKGSWSPQSSSVVYTAQTLSVRQTVASLNAGTCSFYVTIFPLP